MIIITNRGGDVERWRRLPPRVLPAVVASALSVAVALCALKLLGYAAHRDLAAHRACTRTIEDGCSTEDPGLAYAALFGTPLLLLILWQLIVTVALTRDRGFISGTGVSLVWVAIGVLVDINDARPVQFVTPMAVLNVAVTVLLWRARSARLR